ncbi:BgTH12-01527 [Blumeria graminis f. sp. triticale]|uniref:BgTH12-01527 n=1 Tax=Blumeria graminis f. sp. triticale TaxID=1689686 RepID=A0A9W4GEW7_BLUGR|nr:BgTH12-01527 [Blumeria graminis f. sp. triticale]
MTTFEVGQTQGTGTNLCLITRSVLAIGIPGGNIRSTKSHNGLISTCIDSFSEDP